MKYINIKIGLIFIALLSFSCGNDEGEDDKKNVTLIFGWFSSSNCSGDCADIYMLSDKRISKDIAHDFPDDNYFEGNFQEIVAANYDDFKALLDLPKEIFNEPNGYLDCDGCIEVDSGGFYLEYISDDIHKLWRFRNAQYPSYIENYRSLLLDKLADLNSL